MAEQDIFSFADGWAILRRRSSMVIAFFMTTVIVVAIGTYLTTPIYRATATLLIDIESPDVITTTKDVGVGSRSHYSYVAYKEYYKSQLEIIISHSIAEEVFEELNLSDSEDYADAEEPIKSFSKSVSVEQVPNTRLVKLHVENKDPELAAEIANSIAGQYIRRNLAYISTSERLNLLKNEYLRLEAKLSQYSKIYKPKHPEMIKVKEEMAEIARYIEYEKGPGPSDSDIERAKMQEQYQHTLASLKANNVSLIDPARKPKFPIKPNKKLNLLLAVLVGLFGGTSLALFIEYQDATVKDLEDVEKLTKWPFLGNVPRIPGGKKEFYAQRNTSDFITEAYRSISTRIFLSDTKEQPLKSIAISSLGAEEGKTTNICNLGIVIAQNKKRVLLVDADMHRPRLQKVFKSKAGKGLSNFLTGQAGYEEIIQKTDIENLFLVADDQPSQNPSVLLGSDKMKEFVSFAKEKFDFVLFDTPPIAAITDATIISQMVDGIILMIESGKTPKKLVLRNHKLLEDSKIRCAGVIIVKAPPTSNESYYYYHHRSKKAV